MSHVMSYNGETWQGNSGFSLNSERRASQSHNVFVTGKAPVSKNPLTLPGSATIRHGRFALWSAL